jgi:hypothetical protein
LEVFLSNPLISDWPEAAAPPLIEAVNPGADHLYNVPAGTIPLVPLVGVMLNGAPLQVTAVIALMSAMGLNVTITEKGALEIQLVVEGETV